MGGDCLTAFLPERSASLPPLAHRVEVEYQQCFALAVFKPEASSFNTSWLAPVRQASHIDGCHRRTPSLQINPPTAPHRKTSLNPSSKSSLPHKAELNMASNGPTFLRKSMFGLPAVEPAATVSLEPKDSQEMSGKDHEPPPKPPPSSMPLAYRYQEPRDSQGCLGGQTIAPPSKLDSHSTKIDGYSTKVESYPAHTSRSLSQRDGSGYSSCLPVDQTFFREETVGTGTFNATRGQSHELNPGVQK